ncbi:putative disease resistance protein [Camellia lanceoleosa]|uniref:Disease resistance protein n=1 Tax=Camellia lanceoleosa TaxID=1840588 RepID=A0ACC0FEA4_9ERIC|nr:putative disease resistance protein [Camellia lanceoleosa]
MPNLKELTPELCTLTNLKEFTVWNCPSLLSFPDTGLPPMLTRLSIWDCKVLHSLPSMLTCLPKLVFPRSEDMENCNRSLETLSLSWCDALKPMWLGFFPKLRSLQILACTNFNSITDLNMLGLQNLTSLESLFLNGFSNLISFPRGGLPGINLTDFTIWHCAKLKSLPERMHTLFPSLQSLELYDCPEIESLPEGGLPSSLHSLEIRNCSKLTARRREWDLQRLPSLRHFRLVGEYWRQFFPEDGVESFPEEGLLPSTLMSLSIENLPNLKSLNNRGLQFLGSLKYMKIEKCPQLQSLLEEGLPTSLFMLEFFGCPMLKPHYLKGKGQDWHKIACVPVIHMDGEVIFEQLTLRPAMDSALDTLYVLRHYKWPEYLETDFVFNSLPIGSVTAQFLAAFSMAFVKTSVQFSEFEESDPDDVTKRNRHRGKRKAYQHQSADYFHQNSAFEIYDQTKLPKEQVHLQLGRSLHSFWLHFSAASRKTSVQFSESEESDPDVRNFYYLQFV